MHSHRAKVLKQTPLEPCIWGKGTCTSKGHNFFNFERNCEVYVPTVHWDLNPIQLQLSWIWGSPPRSWVLRDPLHIPTTNKGASVARRPEDVQECSRSVQERKRNAGGRTQLGGPRRVDPGGWTQQGGPSRVDPAGRTQQGVPSRADPAGRTQQGGPSRADPAGRTQQG